MASTSYRIRLLVVLLILVGGMLPVALYWTIWGRVPTVTVEQSKAMLANPASHAILVDIRPPQAYQAAHLDGATNWPFEQIMALDSVQLARRYPDRTLLLICDAGLSSAVAARKLQDLSLNDVFSVEGGMQAWTAGAGKPCGTSFCTLRTASGATAGLPFRDALVYEQWAGVLSAFAVKPTYMAAALVLAFVLRRQRAADLAALRWGLIFFFAGEAFCAVNYLVFSEESFLMEYLHSFGMVLSFAFATYAIFEGIDSRLIHYSDAAGRCAAVELCQGCIKHADVPCGLKRVFELTIPILIALAAMPLCGEPLGIAYNTRVLGTLYTYMHPAVYQVFETRFCPLAAMLLLAISLAILLVGGKEPVRLAKVFLAAGTGYLSFSLLRMTIFRVFQDNQVWFATWEELTELAFIAGVAGVLWIFRHGLFSREVAA